MNDLVVVAVLALIVAAMPFVLGLVAPRRGRAVNASGALFALGVWFIFVFGADTNSDSDLGESIGERVAFSAVYVGVCLVIWITFAWAGRITARRLRKSSNGTR
jgi:hypothetical protein